MTIRDQDLRLRPPATPEDILRVVPGLVIAQHQGGGKADQLFLRGFDADHGTDVALSIDGIPINLPSHAHGQGYADLHFLIPEVVDRVDVLKGPYFVEVGDFATAGAVNLRTRRSLRREFGPGHLRLLPDLAGPGHRHQRSHREPGLAAAEVDGTQGPFLVGEDLRRYNGLPQGELAAVADHPARGSRQRLRIGMALERTDPASVSAAARVRPGPPRPVRRDRSDRGGQDPAADARAEPGEPPSEWDELHLTAYVVRSQLDPVQRLHLPAPRQGRTSTRSSRPMRASTAGLNATYRHRVYLGSVRTVTTLGAQAAAGLDDGGALARQAASPAAHLRAGE